MGRALLGKSGVVNAQKGGDALTPVGILWVCHCRAGSIHGPGEIFAADDGVTTRGGCMGLIVCSNSMPRWNETGLSPRSPGGLVPLLAALLKDRGGDWVCTAPADRSVPDTTVRLKGDITLHPVQLDPQVQEDHYLTIGVRLMLWLFHYLLDTPRDPLLDSDFTRAWGSYEVANRAYADRLAALNVTAGDDLLVNDYHLFLVPEMVTSAGGPRPATLSYFHGLPWCEPQYYAILPAAIRSRILASLLCCDVVGFHDSRWADAFTRCCLRLLPGCQAGAGWVTYRERTTRIAVTPFPVDTGELERLSTEERTLTWRQRIAEQAHGRRIVARADRLDLWKNHLRGFAAYRSLLEANPRLAHEWHFCAVTTTPTRTTERSRAYQQECEAAVNEINERFAPSPEMPAVSLVYPDAAGSRHCVTALLSQADVTLVNPIIDGMNLVAKEALFLGRGTPVLLSVNAGAFEHLAPYVTPIEPFDTVATADALLTAMQTPPNTPAPDAGRDRQTSLSTALAPGAGATTWWDNLRDLARQARTSPADGDGR